MESVLIRNQQSRCPESGKWFLNLRDFDSWLASRQAHGLWVTAPPGYGKTILASTAIEKAKQQAAGNLDTHIAFFFCQGQAQDPRNQTLSTVFATLISQIVAEQGELPSVLTNAFRAAQRCGRSRVSLADHPVSLFRDIVCSQARESFLLIDGLDEFPEAGELARSLVRLLEVANNLRILLFSRPMPVLDRCLSKLARLRLTPDLVGRDIELFIHHELGSVEFGGDEIRCIVLERLYSQSKGMFLWTKLMVQTLKSATSSQDMLEMLRHPPTGLGELYKSLLDAMAGQPDSRRRLARKVLLWTCYAARPLTWPELQCALAFESRGDFRDSCKLFKTAVSEACSPLIEHIPTNDTFQPVHTSVVEYITCSAKQAATTVPSALWTREFCHNAELVHLEMARLCLECVSADARPVGLYSVEFLAFVEYATRFWCWHLGKAAYCPVLDQRIRKLLANSAKRRAWITRLLFSETSQFPLQYGIKQAKVLPEWLRKGGVESIDNLATYWVQDVQEIFLLGGNNLRTASMSNCVWGVAIDKITYFEKLMVIRDLSREYTMAGCLAEGEARFEATLKAQQERLGERHISCAILLNSLAIIYDQQGRSQCAAKAQEQALSIQESSLGPEHLEAIWTVNELGRMYRHLGMLDKAEAMHLRALKTLRRVLPSNDLQIAWTLNTLGRTYRKQSRYAKAAALHEEALGIQKSALGEKHPHRLWAMMDLAACLRGQGRLRESAALYADALEGRVEVLGTSHADTLWAMNNLGLLLEDLGDLTGAIAMHREALRGQEALLGISHKHTSWTQEIIGRLERRLDGHLSPVSDLLPLWASSKRDQTEETGFTILEDEV
jgi:tetratricopeptide (TPR) repeat protein